MLTKSPEQIKEGLECCTDGNVTCTQCPYYDLAPDCSKVLRTDYRALFQQLKAERDQAVSDLKMCANNCLYCKHYNHGDGDKTCVECGLKGVDRWEWRGVVTKEG